MLQVSRTFLYNLILSKISATNGKKQLWDKKKVQKIENKRVIEQEIESEIELERDIEKGIDRERKRKRNRNRKRYWKG